MLRKSQNREQRKFEIPNLLFTLLRGTLLALTLVATHEATGGRLDDLEQKVSKKSAENKQQQKEKPPPCHNKTACAASHSSIYSTPSQSRGSLGSLWGWLIMAPFQPSSEDGWTDERGSIYPSHLQGQATAPYARIDYNRQYIDSLTQARDLRLELGYKLIAFHGRTTRYDDGSDRWDINQYYGVLRYGGYRPDFLPGTFEFGIGLGMAQVEATDKDSSEAATLSFKYYPADWGGLEIRSAWYKWMDIRISDYDLSTSIGHRFIQVRAGYRWLRFSGIGSDLNGPYAGISASF